MQNNLVQWSYTIRRAKLTRNGTRSIKDNIYYPYLIDVHIMYTYLSVDPKKLFIGELRKIASLFLS